MWKEAKEEALKEQTSKSHPGRRPRGSPYLVIYIVPKFVTKLFLFENLVCVFIVTDVDQKYNVLVLTIKAKFTFPTMSLTFTPNKLNIRSKIYRAEQMRMDFESKSPDFMYIFGIY